MEASPACNPTAKQVSHVGQKRLWRPFDRHVSCTSDSRRLAAPPKSAESGHKATYAVQQISYLSLSLAFQPFTSRTIFPRLCGAPASIS